MPGPLSVILAACLVAALQLALVADRLVPIGETSGNPQVVLAGLSAVHVPDHPDLPALREITGAVRPNETITELLQRQGMGLDDIHSLVTAARPVYNLAMIRAEQRYRLHYTPAGEFRDFVYPVDTDRYLTVYRHDDRFVPVMKEYKYQTSVRQVSGIIDDSLYMSVKRSGEEELLAVDLAGIFQWDIDFNTDIQQGDSYRMLVEKRSLDDRFVKYGDILAAEMTVGNKTFAAYRFAADGGKARYYSADGTSLNKSFLKSPLPYTRISSRFTMARRHPILKIVRPHLGVDYAAPQGTQVVAVAAGRVVLAGWNGGYGNMVQVRHARGYETMYAHLSTIQVCRGQEVSQGDHVGLVGMTGLATGPHLDFRILQHGRYVNPLKRVFPPQPPVAPELMPEFIARRDELRSRLNETSLAAEAGSR